MPIQKTGVHAVINCECHELVGADRRCIAVRALPPEERAKYEIKPEPAAALIPLKVRKPHGYLA